MMPNTICQHCHSDLMQTGCEIVSSNGSIVICYHCKSAYAFSPHLGELQPIRMAPETVDEVFARFGVSGPGIVDPYNNRFHPINEINQRREAREMGEAQEHYMKQNYQAQPKKKPFRGHKGPAWKEGEASDLRITIGTSKSVTDFLKSVNPDIDLKKLQKQATEDLKKSREKKKEE